MRTKVSVLLAVLLFVLCLVQGAFAVPLFKKGETVVIYGDSITEQQLYSRYVQQYFQCRYPEMKLRFMNAGWGGDTAAGALGRLERDVLILKPSVVTLFFGMNDGGYTNLNQEIVSKYRTNMENLIKTLLAKKIRVIVFTPSCVDYDQSEGLKNVQYNQMLEALGTTAIELAKQYNCAYYDVFHPMLKVQEQQKAKDPKFTMIPDSVHPNPTGHLVMAYYMLQGLGAEPMLPIGSIDLTTGAVDNLELESRDISKIVLKTKKQLLPPFWFSPESSSVMNDIGFLDMIAAPLRVQGLSGMYKLSIDDKEIGVFSAAELAAGTKTAYSNSARGKLIHDLIQRKESSYYNFWRVTRLSLLDTPDIKKIEKAGMAFDKTMHDSILKLAAPIKSTITLERQ